MRAYYDITEKLRDWLVGNELINVVTIGDISEVDLNKQGIFPLAHVIVNAASLDERVITFDISILLIDVVDTAVVSTKDVPEAFKGDNNLQDVYNSMLAVGNELSQQLMRGDLFSDYFQVVDAIDAEPFQDRFANALAGWSVNFSIEVPNNDTGVC